MLANKMYFRVLLQKTPSGATVGLNVIAGYNPKITFGTREFVDSLSLDATNGDVAVVVARFAKISNAAETECCTSANVQKLLNANDMALEAAFA